MNHVSAMGHSSIMIESHTANGIRVGDMLPYVSIDGATHIICSPRLYADIDVGTSILLMALLIMIITMMYVTPLKFTGRNHWFLIISV